MNFKVSRLNLVLALLGALNLGLATALVMNWHASEVQKVSTSPGMRADLIEVDRPWAKTAQAQPEPQKTIQPSAPRIDLKSGQAALEKAMGTGSAVVQKITPAPLLCRVWGPLLASESGRVADSLKGWTGTFEQTEKQVPVGYVVYLPKDLVAKGLGIPQLQAKGVSEVYFMASPGPLQGAVSLGLFRDREHAQQQQDNLTSKGIPGVEIAERLGPPRLYYIAKGTAEQITQLERIQASNRLGRLDDCPAS
ncbi:MAG TPA: hypothetical protein VFX23_08695 [Limnobacter sp.]|uniref:hypothetical protein n=1 Tax=Limnobacter sp. TaxID=2003368 RepID=UPI002E2EDCBB|nr:hypothetical protein [Limnobacter sp.]HEX5486063.1 hypothetical protein [Limnobacter sp.]